MIKVLNSFRIRFERKVRTILRNKPSHYYPLSQTLMIFLRKVIALRLLSINQWIEGKPSLVLRTVKVFKLLV